MPMTVVAQPAAGAAHSLSLLDEPKVADVLREANEIVAAATPDATDRNLLTATRFLRNQLLWNDALTKNGESVAIWKAGANIFAKGRELDRVAGRTTPLPDPVQRFPDLAVAMHAGDAAMARGDALGALKQYALAVREGSNYEPAWLAGLAAAKALAAQRRAAPSGVSQMDPSLRSAAGQIAPRTTTTGNALRVRMSASEQRAGNVAELPRAALKGLGLSTQAKT